jgi:CDP-diacylglycerol--serine O-phosphatidyltransferase
MALGLRPREDLPLTRLLPNMLTLLSLASGLTAMRFALDERWHEAVLGILAASIFDVLDGRVARMLNIASKFGAELDSLSDVVSFGVAPGFIMYLWTLKDQHDLGWIAVLVFAVCTALRLARFNTMLEDHAAPAWAKSYFTGVPAPAGACLALLPLLFFLQYGPDAQAPAATIAFWQMLIGGLMVSRVPTLSMKGQRVKRVWVTPIFVLAILLVAGVITKTWLTLLGLDVLYFMSIPLGWYLYRRRAQREAKGA